MPRRSILTNIERSKLLALPESAETLLSYYTLSDEDLSLIQIRRGDSNRLGFAVLLSLLRYPGHGDIIELSVATPLVLFLAKQLDISPHEWCKYGKREETRRGHLIELRKYLHLSSFSNKSSEVLQGILKEQALQTDKGVILVEYAINYLRSKNIILPPLSVLETISTQALSQANVEVYTRLTELLSEEDCQKLDSLLGMRPESSTTWLSWLRQSSLKATAKGMLAHLERLENILQYTLPEGVGQRVHQNKLLKLAREGAQMSPRDLARFEPLRRRATLVAMVVEMRATITDEILALHDRIIGNIFSHSKNRQEQQQANYFKKQEGNNRLNAQIGSALISAHKNGEDLATVIESIISWTEWETILQETEVMQKKMPTDYISFAEKKYMTLRLYLPSFTSLFTFYATPSCQSILDGVAVVRDFYESDAKAFPLDPPSTFVKPRWKKLVMREDGVHRKFYELCLFSELRDRLRAGDIWVERSRQFRDFEEYLVSKTMYANALGNGTIPLSVPLDCEEYLSQRVDILTQKLKEVDTLAQDDLLDGVKLSEKGLHINSLEKSVPPEAQKFIEKIAQRMPRTTITDVLLDVDESLGFSNHFTHLKTGLTLEDRKPILNVILADAINLGLQKMAEATTDTTYDKLSWIQSWYMRDETYSAALAEVTNAQFYHPFASHWGDGTTSSSDGQRFPTGSHAASSGHVNLKYGTAPGRMVYTHISDQYAPYHTKLINVGVRDSTYVLDGLLYHESDIEITDHFTDTAGFTDHVFGMTHLLGFRFAPRIRDLDDVNIFVPEKKLEKELGKLSPQIGGTINLQKIREHWHEILRLAYSIREGTVTASLMLRKLGSYPRQNGLALALRELGRIERSILILDWISDPQFRRKATRELNKGESRNALARAIHFYRLGEIREKTLQHQQYRMSGLNLATSVIVYWNTVHIDNIIQEMRKAGEEFDETLLEYLSPLNWEHINLTGYYLWRDAQNKSD